MKKIVSSLLFLSILLFQQTVFADSKDDLTYNIQTTKTKKEKVKAEKEMFYYYVNVNYHEQIPSLADELLQSNLSKKSRYKILYNTANSYFYLKKYEKAIEMAQKAEYLYPKKIEIKLLFGNIYKNSNLHELAILKFKECLDLNRDNIEALKNLGEIYYIQGNYKTALQYYKKAEKESKSKDKKLSTEDYINMAISAKEIGLILQAQSILENIKEKNKKSSLLLADIYHSKQNFDKAIKILLPFVYKDETDIEIYCNLAQLYLLSNKFDEAKDLLLYFKSKNKEKFEVIDLLLTEAYYNIDKNKDYKLKELNKISDYTNSQYLKDVIKKVIIFEQKR